MDQPFEKHIVNKDTDIELFFATEVLNLKSLHYGYWEPNEPLTMENFHGAQTRYTIKLIEQIPEDVKTILDVGCGIGDVATMLLDNGYEVTAISPDKNHRKYFQSGKLREATLHSQKFEELNIPGQFDLILMSESQNYFDAEKGFLQVKRYLKPNGYLLVSGRFRKQRSDFFKDTPNVKNEYIEKAGKHGLHLIKSIDITSHIIPTLQLVKEIYAEYVLPLQELAKHYLEGSPSIKLRILKWFLRKEIDRARFLQNYYLEQLDLQLFQEHVSYDTQLYIHRDR